MADGSLFFPKFCQNPSANLERNSVRQSDGNLQHGISTVNQMTVWSCEEFICVSLLFQNDTWQFGPRGGPVMGRTDIRVPVKRDHPRSDLPPQSRIRLGPLGVRVVRRP